MNIGEIVDRKLLKFVIVGIINTVCGSLIMFMLYNAAHFSYWVSSACNYIVTSFLSFFLNKYFTFGIRHWSVFMIISFAANIVFSYVIAYGAAKPIMEYFLQNTSQKFRENAALLAGMCLFTGINYLGQRFVVFRNKLEEQ